MAGGRARELQQIERANRAAAVSRLLLAEIRDWDEFIEAGHVPSDLPRRNIKGGARDVRRNVSRRIKSWAEENFVDADIKRLGELYEDIRAHRGLEIPLREFELRFFKVRKEVLRGAPRHATVVISLWGLQFMFPEDFLTKDILTALARLTEAEEEFQKYQKRSHQSVLEERDRIGNLLRMKAYAQRSALHACFALLEAYLNGLAWAAVEGSIENTKHIRGQDKVYLNNCTEKSLRSRLVNIPRILGETPLWVESDVRVAGILDILKPYRDSLTHPSPFRAPEKFGGYDKLSLFYRVDADTAILAARHITEAARSIHKHVRGEAEPEPGWLVDLSKAVEEAQRRIGNSA